GNVISGNGQIGVNVLFPGSSGNAIQGNLIGTNAAGTAALGNFSAGINFYGAPNNLVGGADPGARNVISASRMNNGILIWLPTATGDEIGRASCRERVTSQGVH